MAGLGAGKDSLLLFLSRQPCRVRPPRVQLLSVEGALQQPCCLAEAEGEGEEVVAVAVAVPSGLLPLPQARPQEAQYGELPAPV